MSVNIQSSATNLLAVPNDLLLPNLHDGHSSIGSLSGRSSSIGFGSCGESLIGADWLEEIEFALKELIIENERESKAEKIQFENIEVDLERIQLTKEEEKEIQKRVKSQLTQEYKKILYEAHEKSKVVKRNFRVFLEEARDALVKARVKAEQKRTEDEMRVFEDEHAKILQKRTKLKNNKKLSQDKNQKQTVCSKEHDKERAMEMGHLRKIQSELDRLRTRAQRQKKSAMRIKKEQFKRKDALLHLQVKRLERDRELHSLILEIYDHGLHEHARTLTNALSVKEDATREIEERMRKAKQTAKLRALERLRRERIEEKERKERERIEQERLRKIREEEERRQKLMMLLRRRAHNLQLQSWSMTSQLNLRMSKSYTFSYF